MPDSQASKSASSITATKTDSLVATGSNLDGRPDPLDQIDYTVQINNGWPDPATNLQFAYTIDGKTTLVTTSLNVSTMACDAIYETIGGCRKPV